MKPNRRRLLAASIALAVAPVLAACGEDSGEPNGSTGSDASASETEEGAFPVTIEHKFGSTEITEAPERVVVVGLTDQDALLALGVVPVGVTYWYGDKALGGINPWAEEALGDAEPPELLDNTNGIDIEAVAALAPDLIIGQYAGVTQKEYDLLSAARTRRRPAGRLRRLRRAVGGVDADHRPGRRSARGCPGARRRGDRRHRGARRSQPRVRRQVRGRGDAVRGSLRLRAGGPAIADPRSARLRLPRGSGGLGSTSSAPR